MIEHIHSFSKDTNLSADVVVIGSGAGGSLAADYFAGRGEHVLIIEEGPYIQDSAVDIATIRPKIWRDGGVIPIFGNTKFVFAEGRCLGGSTMVNAGLINRPHPHILNEWKTRYGIPGMEEEVMEPYFRSIEKNLSVSVPATEGTSSRLFAQGATALGYVGHSAPTSIQTTDTGETKNTMQTTYLSRALARGATVIVDARVLRIMCSGRLAEKVLVSHTTKDGRAVSLNITCKKVIVAAGSIQSALLLRRSGFTKRVGNTLSFHPTLRVAAEFSEPLHPYLSPMPSFQVKEWAPELSMGISMSAPTNIVSHLSLNWPATKEACARTDSMALFYVMTRGYGGGIVRNIPFWNRAYLAYYALTDRELKNISVGYARLSRILFAAGAQRLYPSIEGTPCIESEQDAATYEVSLLPKKKLNLMSVHSFSSCPMGDESRGAVDPYGKLYGADNIYVCDASILPSAPGTNPQGILMATVLRNLEYTFGDI